MDGHFIEKCRLTVQLYRLIDFIVDYCRVTVLIIKLSTLKTIR